MATTVDASGGDDECMNRDMTNEEMDAHIANEPEFGPLKDAGACSLVGGAVAGGFSCHDSFLDSATIQLLSEGVEGNLCMFCAGACATAGDYCCGTPPAPVYYADKTVNDCTCKDTFVYEGVTYDTCTDVDSEGAPWCEVTDDCVDGYDSYVGMGTFDYCIETDAPSSPPPSPYTGCQDVDEATLGEEWSPIIETYGTACSLVRVLGGMDDGALTCDTELADSPSMQSAAPGVSGTLQEVCPRSCGCPEEEEDDDCVDDTSVAGPEWAPIIAMGGCNMLPTMLSLGLTCDSDLGENAVVQGLAPGVSGGVRQFCGASCGGCVEEEEACVDDTSVAGPEWAPIIAMGGCNMLPTMLSLGLTCDSDLGGNAVVQGLAPGVSGGVRQFCGASCGGCDAPEAEEVVETPVAEIETPGPDPIDGPVTKPVKKKKSKKDEVVLSAISSSCVSKFATLFQDCVSNIVQKPIQKCLAEITGQSLKAVSKEMKKDAKTACKWLAKEVKPQVEAAMGGGGSSKAAKKALKKADKQCKKMPAKKCGKGKSKKVCESKGKGKKAKCGAIGM